MGTLNIPCASRRQRHRGEGERASVPCGTVALFLSGKVGGIARRWRGAERFYVKWNCSLLMSKENQKTTSDFDALDPTGCGTQRPLRALGGTRVLLTAAPTAPPCIRRRRRSSLLRIFLCFSHLRLRRRFYLSAELYALRGRNTCCEAANRRNEKKALSAATSFFPFRQPLWGLKGASSPFLVDPARRNRWWFSGSLLTSKENN